MSSVLCHCTVSYCVYFGVYHKEMAIMKVSHKMGFRDSQSRDKLLILSRTFRFATENTELWEPVRHLQLRCTCRSWRSSFKRPLVCLAKPVGCQGVKKSCYNKHLTFLNEFGGQSSFCAILSWMNHEFFGLTYCFISIFQHVPSSFHSFSAQFHSFSVRFHPIFSAVWALIYLHITWFLNHSQALCWSVWSKWAVSLWPKKRGCKAQLLGGGVCWCWSQFLFIPAKVEGQGATIRVSQPNYPSTD